MVSKREYSIQQYETWLHEPFNSNWGISSDKIIDYLASKGTIQGKLSNYGVNVSWWKKTGVPIIKSVLGEGAYVMMSCIIAEEGDSPNWDWINNIRPQGGAASDLRRVCNKIKQALNNWIYPLCWGAPETGGIVGGDKAGANKVYRSSPNGAIGRYYMAFTLAGNACVWGNAWAQTQYFGNPYDHIIDTIKACGGDPWNGKSTGDTGSSGSDDGSETGQSFMQALQSALANGEQSFQEFIDKLFPKAVYLNNSTFKVLGITFRQYRHYMYIRYPWDNWQGSSGSGSEDSSNANGWYQQMVAELDKIRSKQKSFVYRNIRPQQDLTKVNWADCSGFAGWLARKPFPSLWNNGYTNTATMKPKFNGSVGKVIVEGSQSYVLSQISKLKAGDFFLMGDTSECGAGLYSHVAWCETPDKVWSMERQGLLCFSAKYFLSTWWSPKPYMSICRPNGDPNGPKSGSGNKSGLSDADYKAREWIAQRESGGSYTAQNGRYYGRYQLDRSYLGGDLSPKHQDDVANNYVKNRYGSWVKAKEFWQVHNWY